MKIENVRFGMRINRMPLQIIDLNTMKKITLMHHRITSIEFQCVTTMICRDVESSTIFRVVITQRHDYRCESLSMCVCVCVCVCEREREREREREKERDE